MKLPNALQLVQFPNLGKGWGITSHQASLLLDTRIQSQSLELSVDSLLGIERRAAEGRLPMFRLAIYDEKTHSVLWVLAESIGPAILQTTHDHPFDLAIDQLLLDLEHLTGKTPAAGQSQNNLRQSCRLIWRSC